MKTNRKFIIIYILLSLIVFLGFSLWRFRGFDYIRTFDINEKLANTDQLRIGSYNVKTLNFGKSLDAFVEDVKHLNLDILAVQEVDQESGRSQKMEMLKNMAESANFPYFQFYESMWLGEGSYGLGILSKYPIKEIESLELPNTVFAEPRVLSKATVEINEQDFKIYNTHMSYLNRDVREQQAKFIQEHLNNSKNTILMGDMNNFSIDDLFGIEGMYSWNNTEVQYSTFRTTMFNDNVYVSSNLSTEYIAVQKTSFSDHHMLWGIVSLKEASER